MKHTLILLSLILMVFLAGCIASTTEKKGVATGVVIKSFIPDFAEVRSGETISITLLAENIGEEEATDVKAQLFALNPAEWTLLGTTGWTQAIASLEPAIPAQKLAGENYEFSWTMNAPPNLKVDNTYTADARLYYRYKTSALATLRFLTYDYLKSLPTTEFEKVKKTAGVVQSKVSGAPITISTTVGTRPLVVYKDTEKYSIQFIINNAGQGNPFAVTAGYPPVISTDLYRVKVIISTTGGKPAISCPLLAGTQGEITLTRGISKTLFCDVTVNKADIGNSMDYTVAVSLEYGYFTDASTTIKVLKTESV